MNNMTKVIISVAVVAFLLPRWKSLTGAAQYGWNYYDTVYNESYL